MRYGIDTPTRVWVTSGYGRFFEDVIRKYSTDASIENVFFNVTEMTYQEMMTRIENAESENDLPNILFLDEKESISAMTGIPSAFRDVSERLDTTHLVESKRKRGCHANGGRYAIPVSALPMSLLVNGSLIDIDSIDASSDDMQSWEYILGSLHEMVSGPLIQDFGNFLKALLASQGTLFYDDSLRLQAMNVDSIVDLVLSLHENEIMSSALVDQWTEYLYGQIPMFLSAGYRPFLNSSFPERVFGMPKSEGLPFDADMGGMSIMCTNVGSDVETELIMDFISRMFLFSDGTDYGVSVLMADGHGMVPCLDQSLSSLNEWDGESESVEYVKTLLGILENVPSVPVGPLTDIIVSELEVLIRDAIENDQGSSYVLNAFEGIMEEHLSEDSELDVVSFSVLRDARARTTYYEHEWFDVEGFKSETTFSDGSRRKTDLFLSEYGGLSAGQDRVTAVCPFDSSFSVNISVSVIERFVSSVELSSLKGFFLQGDALTRQYFNMVVSFNSGPSMMAEISSITPGIAFSTGNLNVTAIGTCGNLSLSSSIVVEIRRRLLSVSIMRKPDIMSYRKGDRIVVAGLKLLAVFSDGSEEVVSAGTERILAVPARATFQDGRLTEDIALSYSIDGITKQCMLRISHSGGRRANRSFHTLNFDGLVTAHIGKTDGRVVLDLPLVSVTQLFSPFSVSLVLRTWDMTETPYGKGCSLSVDRRIVGRDGSYIMIFPDGKEMSFAVDEEGRTIDLESNSILDFADNGNATLSHPDGSVDVYSAFGEIFYLCESHSYPSSLENPDPVRSVRITRGTDGRIISIAYGKDPSGNEGTLFFNYGLGGMLSSLSHSSFMEGDMVSVSYTDGLPSLISEYDTMAETGCAFCLSFENADEIVSVWKQTAVDDLGSTIKHVIDGNLISGCIGYRKMIGDAVLESVEFRRSTLDGGQPEPQDIVCLSREGNEEMREYAQVNVGSECGLFRLYRDVAENGDWLYPSLAIGTHSNGLYAENLTSLFGDTCFIKDEISNERCGWENAITIFPDGLNGSGSLSGRTLSRELYLQSLLTGFHGAFYVSMWILTGTNTTISASVRLVNATDEFVISSLSIRAGFQEWQFVSIPLGLDMNEHVIYTVRVSSATDVRLSDFRIWRLPEAPKAEPKIEFDTLGRVIEKISCDPIFGTGSRTVIRYDTVTGQPTNIEETAAYRRSEDTNRTPIWNTKSVIKTHYRDGLPVKVRTSFGTSCLFYQEETEYENGVSTVMKDSYGVQTALSGTNQSLVTRSGTGNEIVSVSSSFTPLGRQLDSGCGLSRSQIRYGETDDIASFVSTHSSMSFIRDSFGDIISAFAGETMLCHYSYDALHRMSQVTYGNGGVASFSYDSMNRVTNVERLGSGNIDISYGPGRCLVSMSVPGNNDGERIPFIYESNVIPSGETTEYFSIRLNSTTLYERRNLPVSSDGRLYSIARNLVSESGRTINERFSAITDELGNLTSFSRILTHSSDHFFNDYSVLLEYDSMNRPAARNLTYDGSAIMSESFSYLELGEGRTSPLVASETANIIGNYIDTRIYSYDSLGRVTDISDATGPISSYSYDECGRVVSETFYRRNENISREYDEDGNVATIRTISLLDENDVNELILDYDSVHPGCGHDARWHDQLKSINGSPIRYDEMGNMLEVNGMSIVWSGRKMVSIGGIRMEYDLDGRRTLKGNTMFIWDGDMLVAEMDHNVTGGHFTYYFSDDRGISGMRYDDTDYFFRKDMFGDVLSIIRSDGTLMCTYSYDAWGKCQAFDSLGNPISQDADHIANKNPFRWRGYYYDVETGLYWLLSRYYDPEIGRFISPDSVYYLDPTSINGLNLYAYCNNDPVNYYDPSGHAPQWLGWLLTGVALAGLTTLTVLSLGTAAPITGVAAGVIIGATCGAYAGAITGIVSQGISNGWSDIDSWVVLKETGVGALSGAISGLGVGVGTTILAGGASQVVSSLFDGTVNSFGDALIQFAIGGLISGLTYGAAKFVTSKFAVGKIGNVIGLSNKNIVINRRLASFGFSNLKVGKNGFAGIVSELYKYYGYEALSSLLSSGVGSIISIVGEIL